MKAIELTKEARLGGYMSARAASLGMDDEDASLQAATEAYWASPSVPRRMAGKPSVLVPGDDHPQCHETGSHRRARRKDESVDDIAAREVSVLRCYSERR